MSTEESADHATSSESTASSKKVDFVIYTITEDGRVQVIEFQEGELSKLDKSVLSVHALLANNPEARGVLRPFPAYLQSLLRSEPQKSRAMWGYHIIEEGLPWISDQDEQKVPLLDFLGNIYNYRAHFTASASDLEKAMLFNTQANLLTPDSHNEKHERLNALGSSYLGKFQRLGDLDDLERAIDYHKQANQLISDEHPNKPGWLLCLAAAVMTRYTRLGDLGDLACAVADYDRAVQLTPQGDPEMSRRLNSLGVSLRARYERLANQPDLDRAISCHTQAISFAPSGSPQKPSWLCELGNSLTIRFQLLGNTSDLDEAISYQRQAVSLAPDEYAAKPGWLNNIGHSLHHRYIRLGDMTDLNDAIHYQKQAVSLAPDNHPSKNGVLSELGRSLMSRFCDLGDLVDLDDSILQHRQAVLLTPEGHLLRPELLRFLGAAQLVRFERLSNTNDINDAISCHKQALSLTPDGHPNKSDYLNSIGRSYHDRFDHLEDLSDLDTAISYHSQAVALAGDDRTHKAAWSGNLGSSFLTRFKRVGDVTDLEKAIFYHELAVSQTPDGHSGQAGGLHNLGYSKLVKFDHSGAQQDLDEAIDHLNRALLLTANETPFKANTLARLGAAHRKRFESFHDNSSLNDSISCYQKAAQETKGSPSARFTAACAWARTALLTPDQSSLEAYKHAVGLIPQIVWLGGTVSHRYKNMSDIGGIVFEAVVVAIWFKEYGLALEWLEEGNSIVWKQILQLRTPLDDVRRVDSGLADLLENTAKELDHAGTTTSQYNSLDSLSVENAAQSHRRLAERYEQLLHQARSLPGYSNFMRPKKASELLPAARYGPVVAINVHPTRCDALVLLPNSDLIAHIPLPRLSYAALSSSRGQFAQLLKESSIDRRGFRNSTSTSPDIVDMLWRSVVKPVFEHLGYMTPFPSPELPHITWCTSGPLAFLPLHAAGNYNESHARVFNYAISSYTPTLSALLTPAPSPDTFRGILAVGQANTPGHSPLPATDEEIAQVTQQADLLMLDKLTGAQATVSAVLGAMEKHSWIHMACHASQNRTDPTKSAFHLHDGPLELAAITQKALKGKGLAFLSACETATGDNNLPNEAVHLAAGMLMAGYPSVIATMWSIHDEDAPLVTEKVYVQLLKGGVADTRNTAKALHDAVGCLRLKVGEKNFARWAPYIHIGL